MEMTIAVQYKFVLNAEEFRLVSKALRGVDMTVEELDAADALQAKMVQLRATQAEQLLSQFDKAAEASERPPR